MRNPIPLPSLTIANGNTSSGVLLQGRIRYMDSFNIYGPATLPETVNIEVSPDGVTWHVLQSAAADIVIGAGKAVSVLTGGFFNLRLTATASVAADRVFKICGTEKYGVN